MTFAGQGRGHQQHKMEICLWMQETVKVMRSATLVRLANSSKLHVSAFLMSLLFGNVSCPDTDSASHADTHAADGYEQDMDHLSMSGSILEVAKSIEHILPTLVNMGLVDQHFSWPLLRLVSTQSGCSSQREAAAFLLARFHATSDQARVAVEFTEPNGGHCLSKAAQAHMQTFIKGQFDSVGECFPHAGFRRYAPTG